MHRHNAASRGGGRTRTVECLAVGEVDILDSR